MHLPLLVARVTSITVFRTGLFHGHVGHPWLFLVGLLGLGVLFLAAVGVILLIVQISRK